MKTQILIWATAEFERQIKRDGDAKSIVFGDGTATIDRCPCPCRTPGKVCEKERERRMKINDDEIPF